MVGSQRLTTVQDLTTVSLDRIIGGRVPVKPDEAHAILLFVWERLCASRDGNGRMMPLPALDALAISATGDIDAMRPSGTAALTMRPPHVVALELGHLLSQLLWPAGPDTADVPAACVDAVRRVTLDVSALGKLRPIASPKALFTALEAFRPRDPNAARAALFDRWLRSTQSAATRTAESRGGLGADTRMTSDTARASRAEGVLRGQASAAHRAGGRSARAAGVALRLHFDATAGPAQQVVAQSASWPARSDRPPTPGRLSLGLAICAAVLGVMPI